MYQELVKRGSLIAQLALARLTLLAPALGIGKLSSLLEEYRLDVGTQTALPVGKPIIPASGMPAIDAKVP